MNKKDERDRLNFNVSLSIRDILSIKMMLSVGSLFTKPQDKERVKQIFKRLRPGLKKAGCPDELIDRLVTI